jgi:hypothetical protein
MKNRFDSMELQEQKDIFINAKWILKRDIKDTTDANLINSCYSGKQHFGYSDYCDHRDDSLDTIRNLILSHCKSDAHTYQRIHFYKDKDCAIPFTKIICYGYYGGISAEFLEI